MHRSFDCALVPARRNSRSAQDDKLIIHKFPYLVKLTNGTMLILEVKGMDDQQQQTKREFLAEWIRAVNAQGGFGHWAGDVSRHPKDVLEILERHNSSKPSGQQFAKTAISN